MSSHGITKIQGSFTVRAANARRIKRHDQFAQAEKAALRLANANPGVVFVINQEVGQVKITDGNA